MATKKIQDIYPLSPMQEGMLFHALANDDKSMYFEQFSFKIKCSLNITLIEGSLKILVQRHDILRTAFVFENIDKPKQVVLSNRETDFYFKDIRSVDASEQNLFIKEYKLKDKNKGFDLSKDILSRLAIFQIKDNIYELIWSFHHIIMDGWCIGIIIDELFKIYSYKLQKQEINLPSVRQFCEYIKYLNNKNIHEAKKFWQYYLQNFISQTLIPKLKYSENIENYIKNTELSYDETEKLESIAKKYSITISTLFHSIWGILLSKYNNTNDVVIGSVTSGRNSEIEGIEKMLGLFINTIPVRINYENGTQFSQLLIKTQKEYIDALTYQYVPLTEIQQVSGIKNQLFDHIIAFDNFPISNSINDINNESFDIDIISSESIEKTNYNLAISIIPEKQFKIIYNYSHNIHEITIENIQKHLKNIINQISLNPNINVNEIELITEEEKQEILLKFNKTNTNFPKNKTISQLFEEQVNKNPHRIALILNNKFLTYHVLNLKTNQLKNILLQKNLEHKSIAILLDRSFEMIISILAILKAGGTYVPIDIEQPKNRINFIIQDSFAKVIISKNKLKSKIDAKIDIIDIENEDIWQNEIEKSYPPPKKNEIAYIIYTSGSTGIPKGALVRHYSVNRVVKNTNYINIFENDKILQLSNYSFDGSVFDIFAALLNSAALILVEKTILLELDGLAMTIKKENITVFFITTALFNSLIEISIESLKNIRKILFGGERVSVYHTRKAFDYLGKDKIIHVYGPTESTVFATYYSINTIDDKDTTIPIGCPLANTYIYILSQAQHLQPIGIPGELAIAGDGLAKEYLKRDELTKEKFITNPIKKGELIYLTGDIARWLPDGNIEFIGRLDDQVKIRGFRIELGEIEHQLQKHEAVKEVFVTTKSNQNGEKHLSAYYVSKKELSPSELREFALKDLPDYMVPSYYIHLNEFPLTFNGKIDKKSLPEPEFIMTERRVAPANKIEKILLDIWSKVLGIEKEKIGITDNFFLLGGDSIKTIQISSRLQKEGYKVSVKDILLYQTIQEIAKNVEKTGITSEQSIITGSVPLTPIQHYFFKKEYIHLHHYNQSVVLIFEKDITNTCIKMIFTKIQEHHDALRMTYRKNNSVYIQENKGLDYPFGLEVFDLRRHENPNKEIVNKANEIQSRMNLLAGPMMKLGLFYLEEETRLLIVIHHLVVDVVSWRILFEDIDMLYGQYQRGEPLLLPAKTDSYKIWSEKQEEYIHNNEFKSEVIYWRSLEDQIIQNIKKTYEGGSNYVEDIKIESFEVSEDFTKDLLSKVNNAYGTQINDILLVSFGLACKKNFGMSKLKIDIEGHGREEIFEGTNVNRTLGWFTCICPVILNINEIENISKLIIENKEILRNTRNNGIGYGIYKYYVQKNSKEKEKAESVPQLSFNYLGQFDTDTKKKSFKISLENKGYDISPKNNRNYELDIIGMISGKRLLMSIVYSKNQYAESTIKELAKEYKESLGLIITHCSEIRKRIYTPSDFTYKLLPINIINELQRLHDIQDIYPLSPMQEGMLFHSIYDPLSFAYFEQTSIRVSGDIDKEIVQKVLSVLIERYNILRTIFIHKEHNRPLQLVLKQRSPKITYKDIRKECLSENIETVLERYREEDKLAKFNLSKDLLIRVALLKINEKEHELIWSFHHILMDGWCLGIIFQEFIELYNCIKKNTKSKLSKVTQYVSYIKWLEKQNKVPSKQYWKNYLEGYEEIKGIPKLKTNSPSIYKQEIVSFEINKSDTEKLKELAGRLNVTLNTIIQGIWAILLSKYNDTNDVVFGSVVSGRPSEIEQIESMIGLFINTIPVRIKYKAKQQVDELFINIQKNAIETEPHHYCSLAEIQADHKLGQKLFDHIIVFENYPTAIHCEDEKNQQQPNNCDRPFKVTKVNLHAQTNYDLNLLITIESEIKVFFKYDCNKFEDKAIKILLTHFQKIIYLILIDLKINISDIEIINKDEKETILYHLNNTKFDYPKDKTVIKLFEEQAERTPYKIATIFGENKLTYKELYHKINILASDLTKRANKSSIVAICVEPSLDMVIGILGIIKSGAAFLPLDPYQNPIRLGNILEDSECSTLITQQHLENYISFSGEKIIIDGDINPIEKFNQELTENDLLYVIYTSGSTGKPKGVKISNDNILNYYFWFSNNVDVTSNDVMILTTSYAFDAIYTQFFYSLLQGCELHIIPRETYLSPSKLLKYIDLNSITFLKMTPTLFNMVINDESFNKKTFRYVKNIMLGGEAIKPKDIKIVYSIHQHVKFINHYGPTETTIGSIATYIEDINNFIKRPVIGRPINNTRCYVFDKDQNLQPFGCMGELYISGKGVGLGYLGKDELTKEKFIEDPFFKDERMYKTGDLVRLLPNGDIEYLGRKDNQVKIRGFRIELGEIQNQLLKYKNIKEVTVVDGKDANEDRYLCAYIVSDIDIPSEKLRDYLSKFLPDYMIPSYFIRLLNIPQTSNGKLDKNALPIPEYNQINYIAPKKEIELKLVKIWAKVLKIEEKKIGIETSFFDLGGHSLKAINAVMEIQKEFNIEMPLKYIFEFDNIKKTSIYLEKIVAINNINTVCEQEDVEKFII